MAVLSKAIHGLWEASLSMSQAETVPLFFGTLQVDKAFYFWEQGGQELPVMGTSQLPVPMHMTDPGTGRHFISARVQCAGNFPVAVRFSRHPVV